MTVVLGISNSHNGSVALIRDGRVLSAIQAERLSRNKREALIIGKNTKLLRDCINYCLEVGKVDQSEINSGGISTPWRATEINDDDLFEFIGACPNNYLGTFYVPHHLAHSEYIVHYGDNDPGLVLVIDGSGTMEEDRKLFK